MELYCYSPEGVCLGLIENYRSFRWVKKYNNVGSFKLVCHPSYRDLLTEGAILWPSGDEEAGCIRTSTISCRNGETLEVSGETLTGLLGRRIIWDGITYTGTEEELMRRIVLENAIEPANPARKIPRLQLAAPCGSLATVEDYTATHEVLHKALATRATNGALGFKTLFDPENGEMTFVIYEGIDRSEMQSQRSPVVFSDAYDNLITAEYRESDTDYANAALVEGEKKKDDAPETVSVGDAAGLERREAFLRASGVKRKQDDGSELTDEQYRAALLEHGSSELADRLRTQAADAEIKVTDGNLVYGEDYALGDIVTLELPRWGVRAHLRLTQVDEAWERGRHCATVTFGEDAHTQLERIERRIG